MNKKLIRLTESDLHRIVKESVNRVLNESYYNSSDSRFNNLASRLMEYLKDWFICVPEEDEIKNELNETLHTLDITLGSLGRCIDDYREKNGTQDSGEEYMVNDYSHSHEMGDFDYDYLH